MLVKLESVYNTFFFLEDLCLTRGKGPQSVDLTDRTDSFIQVIATSVSTGLLAADKSVTELVNLIKDPLTKQNVALSIGLQIEPQFADTVTTEVEVIEVIAEDAETPSEPVVTGGVEDESDDETAEEADPFADLLEGTVKAVTAKIKNADLTEEQKAQVSELEKKGKNRSAVLSAINEA